MADADLAVKGFSVDTHILRELGSLLVGRDSTALLELVKNSYDAEATSVTVDAKQLGDPGGVITLTDNGNGMTYDRFVVSFLRIAGRTKETNRDSADLGRRFTGAKGIGRLAAHKLSSVLEVVSVPKSVAAATVAATVSEDLQAGATPATGTAPELPLVGVQALLDWDAMESDHSNLSDVGSALVVNRLDPSGLTEGTTMTLRGLRGEWSDLRLGQFLDEIRKCRPNDVLTAPLDQKVVSKPILFSEPTVRQHNAKDRGMLIELTGDLSPGDDLWGNLSTRADWVVEIAAEKGKQVRYGIAPTKSKRDSLVAPASPSWATPYLLEADHPDPENGPFFHARFFVTEGTLGTRNSAFGEWARREAGVSVFMEGFRVLPYGTSGDDWLELDRDAARKPRQYDIEIGSDDLEQVDKEGFFQLGNRAYFGAVFLTDAGAPHLQAVVNREGFVPDAYFLSLRDMVRNGIDLSTRARAALQRRVKAAKDEAEAERLRLKQEKAREEAEAAERAAAAERARHRAESGATDGQRGEDDQDYGSSSGASSTAQDPAGRSADDLDSEDPAGIPETDAGEPESHDHSRGSESWKGSAHDSAGVTWGSLAAEDEATDTRLELLIFQMASTVAALEEDDLSVAARTKAVVLRVSLEALSARARTLANEQLTLRVLAGVGTLYSAFVHEVNGLLGQSKALRGLVDTFPQDAHLSRNQRATMRDLRGGSDELVQSLTRQASYLTEVVGPDSRRRRRRMPLAERVEIALRLLNPQIAERGQRVEFNTDDDVATPPIFAAELAIVLTNLLTNATKFAGRSGVISVSGFLDEEMGLHIVVQNTGDRVAPENAERFFRPFESTTTEVDLVLGQGMGLGLPIVRNLLEGYGGSAKFVTPTAGFATAIEVQLPDPRPDVARKRGAA